MKELSRSEKEILYQLVRYPKFCNNEISNSLGYNSSTFSMIKKRLYEKGYFNTVRVPNFPRIGFELFKISYGYLNRTTAIEQRLGVAKEMFNNLKEFVIVFSESNQAINIAVAKNYTESEKGIDQFVKLYSEHNYIGDEGFNYITFPFEITSVYSFFNYAPLLKRHFGLNFDDNTNGFEIKPEKTKALEMTTVEKLIYYGLIKYPELSDTNLAEKIKSSRNTIAKLKKKFFEEELIIQKRIPNLKILGFELFMCSHYKLNPRTALFQRQQFIDKIQNELNPIFFISKNLESLCFTVFNNFEEYKIRYGELLNYFLENNILKEEPVNLLLSAPQMTIIKNHTYADLIKKELKIS